VGRLESLGIVEFRCVRCATWRGPGDPPRHVPHGWDHGEAAGTGIILSWFFTTGYKLVVPVAALVWIVIAEGITDTAIVTLAVIGLAAVLGAASLIRMVLYRERIALRLGDVMERSYNKFAGAGGSSRRRRISVTEWWTCEAK
jgi:hypothetical protein